MDRDHEARPYEERPPNAGPATGSADPARTELAPDEEPVTTGTLFLTMIILMIIGAVWLIIYWRLIDR